MCFKWYRFRVGGSTLRAKRRPASNLEVHKFSLGYRGAVLDDSPGAYGRMDSENDGPGLKRSATTTYKNATIRIAAKKHRSAVS